VTLRAGRLGPWKYARMTAFATLHVTFELVVTCQRAPAEIVPQDRVPATAAPLGAAVPGATSASNANIAITQALRFICQ
jgi:hypothetical protein